MNQLFLARLRSFGWRLLAYLVSMALAWMANNLTSLELDPFYVATIGLVLGECSKAWANYQKTLGKSFFGRTRRTL